MRQNPVASLPLFAFIGGSPLFDVDDARPFRPSDGEELHFPLTPTAHGQAGAEDAQKHLHDHAPAFVLEALGDALLAYQGRDFTAEMVRHTAEQSEAVKGWLAVKGRENCFPGWWRSRIRLHRLERTGQTVVAQRGSRRGGTLPVWRFPR